MVVMLPNVKLIRDLEVYGALIASIGLFWFAFTTKQDVHWMSPIAASVPFAWGNLMIFVG